MTKSSNLVVPRSEARERITAQLEKGRQLRDRRISSEDQLEESRAEAHKWWKFNSELLSRIFENATIADEYDRFVGILSVPHNPTLDWKIKDSRRFVSDGITRLESIVERLELFPERLTPVSQAVLKNTSSPSGDVFVVHGTDEAAKNSTSRFLEKLGIKALILHEQPNRGRTIIEKFEDHSSVSYAIVLLTSDDLGALQDGKGNLKDQLRARARQNVIFELGFFAGKLGRSRVCVLYREGVEVPSDFGGVIYIPLDANDGWRLKLAKEMKAAGLKIDLNLAM